MIGRILSFFYFSYAVLLGVRAIHVYENMLTMLAAGSIVPRRADTGASVRVTYAAVVTDGTVGGTVWTVLLGRAV